jgi:hypothetical protein
MPSQRRAVAAEPDFDWPLTFHWRGITPDQINVVGLPATGSSKRIAARCSILTDLVLARQAGDRWVSYSRRRDHYSAGQRYRGTAYTYRSVVGTVSQLSDRELIEEQRARPGTRGWQSRMRATDRLVLGLGALAGLTYDPVETVRLKNANGQLVDYRDGPATRRMRGEIRQLNARRVADLADCRAPTEAWLG